MGKEISIFNSYDTQENRTTNYCGLMLKTVYQRSPEAFQTLISSLLEDSSSFDILPSFQQQIKQKNSIPDLTIQQKSFTILFETKTTDWHYSDQLSRHIEGIEKADVEILFLLSDEYSRDIDERIREAKQNSTSRSIIIKNITFDEFLTALSETIKGMGLNENDYLCSLLDGFEKYLVETNLLPRWNRKVLIVPCGNTTDEIKDNFYACPNKNGIYSYARAKFFGAYWSKRINYLAEIKAVVKINDDENFGFTTVWNNSGENDSDLFRQAKTCLNSMTAERQKWARSGKWQIFLFGNKQEVDIEKKTKGGLRGKTYWEIDADLTLTDAVNQLMERDWQ